MDMVLRVYTEGVLGPKKEEENKNKMKQKKKKD